MGKTTVSAKGREVQRRGIPLGVALRDLKLTPEQRKEFRRGYRLSELDSALSDLRVVAQQIPTWQFKELLEELRQLYITHQYKHWEK